MDNLTINTIRTLAVDAIEKAKSGHPGMPLGAAPTAYELWAHHLNFTHQDLAWINRDRFILSAGHASALLYALLHLFKYDVSIDDLKEFRQLNSITPGHPEYRMTPGVEATTGPLGAGLATAVGLAMAQAHMAAVFNKPEYEIFNNYTYVLAGDGCMMEGITSEASSLAGTLNLGRLIIIYDSNNITIEGKTDLAFQENVRARYQAYGFETYLVEDGNDLAAIAKAISQAKANLDQPSFIEIKTKIGYGSLQEDQAAAHGAPLGEASLKVLKDKLNYPSHEPFFVEPEVYQHTADLLQTKEAHYEKWLKLFEDYKKTYPELALKLNKYYQNLELEEILGHKSLFEFEMDSISTRNASGLMINRLSGLYENLIGGSADLAGSTMTLIQKQNSYSKENYSGRNLHFGVREHAMAGIGNGLTLYGGLHPYVATFFVFADFLKPMLRLSALMEVPLVYILTHDSIGVGEDGPTHEPIEQLTMLRATPNLITFRPADAKETAYGWAYGLASKLPTALILSRQNLPVLKETSKNALLGGYVVLDHPDYQAILIASGSEVSLALKAAEKLAEEKILVRVVSMPSLEIFQQQSLAYQNEVLPNKMRKRLVIEAGSKLSWGGIVGLDGAYLTIDRFGESAPGDVLFKHFGFDVDNVIKLVKDLL